MGPNQATNETVMPRDPQARLQLFEACILPYLNPAYNLAKWLARNEQDAQDIVQESFLRAYRFFDGYKGGDPKSWLMAIVRNTYITWRQHQKRQAASEPFDETAHSGHIQSPTQEQAIASAVNQNTLRNCIELLPPEFREVIVLRELEEMSYREISEVTSLPAGTVMSRLSRARKRLEDCARSLK